MNKKIKLAIIGAGEWGKTHAYLYDEHKAVELVAICDLKIEKARELATEFSVPHVFSNHNKMLESIDFDAVSIVTPDFSHAQIAVDCANAGKDMLIEKPLATTRKDLEEIWKAVKDNDVRVMVDLHNRWNPPFAVAKESLDKGDLGKPISSYFRLNDIKWVATDMLPWADKSSILWFLGSHSVDTVRWFFNDEVDEVYSVSHYGVLKDLGIDTEDVYQTILKFKNGGIATLENGWITPNSYSNINDIKFNITGSKGVINLDLTNNNTIERFSEDKNDNPDILVKHFIHGKAKGFAYESIRDFIDKLISGDNFLVSVKDAINTSLVILAIMESAKSGKPVKVEYLKKCVL